MDKLEQAKQNLEKALEEFLFACNNAGVGRDTSIREVRNLLAEGVQTFPFSS